MLDQQDRVTLKEYSQRAFLGSAYLNISESNTRMTIEFGTYNPGRQIQQAVFQSMVEMMKLGQCDSDRSPLIIAIDANQINHETLVENSPNSSKALVKIGFSTEEVVRLELLAGMHRVKAARTATTTLRKELENLKAKLADAKGEDSEDDDYSPGEESGPPEPGTNHHLQCVIKKQITMTKGIIKKVERWPVQFYDIGWVHSPVSSHAS